MRVLCIGGGPAGLYFGLAMKLRDPGSEVWVVERNRPGDTFGWGVVFSDATMHSLWQTDPVSARRIDDAFNRWDDIEIQIKDRTIRSGGHGFIGIGRRHLLDILRQRCAELGVHPVFDTEVADEQALASQYGADLIVAADGIHSRIRARYAATFCPDIDTRRCRFVWLGTHRRFEAFTFAFERTRDGWFQAHAYRFDDQTSTFIVETPEPVWRAAGLESMSQQQGIAFCETLFARLLQGHRLISNAAHLRGSASWIRFPRVVCKRWTHWTTLPDGRAVPIVLMGDAAHSAHFSIGSGTRLALDDAIALADALGGMLRPGEPVSAPTGAPTGAPFRAPVRAPIDADRLAASLSAYEAARGVEVLKLQNAARNSTEWFENVARYAMLPPEQFAYSLLTRSQRISHENLRLRDRGYLEGFERWLAARCERAGGPDARSSGAPATSATQTTPPMFTPFRVRDVRLKNRVVVSPMAMYSCVDGVPGDFHLAHLGARALGGAGLVMAEMTCVTPRARITPACPGLWNDAQRDAWARIVAFCHAHTDARIGIQLGHAGRKGSTQVGWERMDHPLPEGNWPLVSASPLPYLPGISQTPAELSEAEMDSLCAAFGAAARRAAAAGFDWLELHCAHGYLLSSFISPVTNRRTDGHGGSLENRLRFPLAVFAAVREAWPGALPVSVRISAHDWVEGGITPDDAVAIARAFKAAGADMIDCSSGQVSPDQSPVYGRMYQTPFADRIRNEAQIPTIAVGAISEADHVNSIIAAGRADLCAIARPHLADAAWTLREAARLGYRDACWPKPYLAARTQFETLQSRAAHASG